MDIINNVAVNTQSSIKIVGSKIIYIDPYLIKDSINDADIILITHDHYDHLDMESIRNVINDKSIIVVPGYLYEKFLDFNNDIIGMEVNNNVGIGNISIDSVRSYNVNKSYHPYDKNNLGYLIEMDNVCYYVMGDTDINDDVKDIKCDILFIPIGGTFTCDYVEASEYVNIMRPKVVIPVHYGSIVGDKDLGDKFKNLINNDIEVILKI